MELLLLAPEIKDYHCPYNPSHTMPYKTLVKHLIKCPDRQHNYRNCVYNYSHVMPQSEIKQHEENCPSKFLVDSALFQSEDIQRPVPIVSSVPITDCEESWDDLEKSDVLKKINQKTVLMKAKPNETKSERKKYRVSLHEHDIENNINSGQRKWKSAPTCQEIQQIKTIVESKEPKTEKKLFIGKRP